MSVHSSKSRRIRLAALLLAGAGSLAALPAAAQNTPVVAGAGVTATGAAGAVATGAVAADDAGSQVAEIVVTARRRAESAQNVPIALSVLGGQSLEKTGTYNLQQVSQKVPSIQFYSVNARNTNLNIRGLGTNIALANDGLESGVGFYLDEVYYSRPGTAMFDLVDLDRVEVLRGPQGTLFGKNTTAGALNLATRQPSFTPEAMVEGSAGNYDFYQGKASISGPLIADQLAGRLAVWGTTRSGFLDNVRKNRDQNDYLNFGFKGQLLYQPNDKLSVRVIADYGNQQSKCCVLPLAEVVTQRADGTLLPKNFYTMSAALGYTPLPAKPFDRKTDVNDEAHANQRTGGLSVQGDWYVSIFKLTSVTAYRYWHWDPANDADYTGLSVLKKAYNADRQKQFSQELRLASTGNGPVDYVGGLYFFAENVAARGETIYGEDATYWLVSPALPGALLDGRGLALTALYRTRSYAAFGQATWRVTDRLSLTGGVRYTHERKWGVFNQTAYGGLDVSTLPPASQPALIATQNAFAANVAYRIPAGSATNGVVTGNVNVSYQATDNLLVYATYAKGAKSGGLNLSSAKPPIVEPEKIDDYEIGLKSRWFDRSLTLNFAGYWTDDTNYQTSIIDFTTLKQYIANIGKVRSRGVEADANWVPAEWISLNLSAAYDDAYFVDYKNGTCGLEWTGLKTICDLTGKPVPGVPKWAISGGGEIHRPLELGAREAEAYLSADFSYHGAVFTQASDSVYSKVDAYTVINAQLGVRSPSDKWDAFIWAKNLLDKDYYLGLNTGTGNTGALFGLLGDPRTFGVTVRFRY